MKIPASMAALVAVAALAGCGGSSKTVLHRQTATAQPLHQPSCEVLLHKPDIRPAVCALPNGTFLKAGTENYPLKLESLTVEFLGAHATTSVGAGAASATANGTFEIITLRVTNNSNSPQTMESIGGHAFALKTLASNSKSYSESFQAENRADQNSFVSQNSTPIQPDASQTGDIVFDLPAPAVASIRQGGAGLLFGDFGTDLTTSSASNDPSHPFGFMIIHHIKKLHP